jgi:hypothetical protein
MEKSFRRAYLVNWSPMMMPAAAGNGSSLQASYSPRDSASMSPPNSLTIVLSTSAPPPNQVWATSGWGQSHQLDAGPNLVQSQSYTIIAS